MSYRSSYAGDPRWITARRAGTCAGCGQPITVGDRAFYYPKGKHTYGGACPCGDAHSRDFEAARMDEDLMGGGH